MRSLIVNIVNKKYPIIITNDFSDFLMYEENLSQKCIVITDSNVKKYHLKTFIDYLTPGYAKVIPFVVNAGEESKCLDKSKEIYQFLLENSIGRNDVIISFGGGVVGDLAGYIAATFMRGLQLIHVPTSLLAQCDSSIGGKTAINFEKAKNVIGAFYQPQLVYINYNVLQTLSIAEIKNGLIEILVHAIIKDADLFKYIEDNLDQIVSLKPSILEELIYWNCQIKSKVIERDEFDKGERAILNFGHTIGHAIESSYDYQYKHGECVALGILAACFISKEMNLIGEDVIERISTLLNRIGILKNIQDCDKEKVYYYLKRDKKVISEKLYFILPLEIGKVLKQEIKDFNLVSTALDQLIEYSKIK